MINYSTKSVDTLTIEQILVIKKYLDMDQFSVSDFRQIFSSSDFHPLTDNMCLVSFARINHDFKLKIGDDYYCFAEFVGFISIIKGKSYGTKLLGEIIKNLIRNHTECIGFCEKPLRGFYEKNNIKSYMTKQIL